jgi:hypothetical protein
MLEHAGLWSNHPSFTRILTARNLEVTAAVRSRMRRSTARFHCWSLKKTPIVWCDLLIGFMASLGIVGFAAQPGLAHLDEPTNAFTRPESTKSVLLNHESLNATDQPFYFQPWAAEVRIGHPCGNHQHGKLIYRRIEQLQASNQR